MATVTSVLALNDKMTKTLQAIQQSTASLSKTMASLDENVKHTSNTMNTASSSSGSFLKSLLGFSAVKSVFSMITSQVGTAIERFDTLTNYKNVMSNLGIDAEASSQSLDRMKQALDGLPTTLQDGASAVQRFTSANGNIQASTEMFLALNNAILAGGASQMTQASALEQLSQAYAKGKPDMMEWRTAMSAMPAQLSQVAKVMGFVNANALGESLRAGTTSMNDFMKTLVEMNQSGQTGFKSFDEQARNATGGIGTAITNLKTAVTKGIAELIERTNESLAQSQLPSISEIIKNIGLALQRLITIVAPVISFLVQAAKLVVDNWSYIAPVVLAIAVAFGIYEAVTLLATAAQWLFNAALSASPLTWIIIAIIAIIAAISFVIKKINEVTGSSISALGVITGALGVAIAFIWNLFLGLLDLVLGIINYWANRLVSFANFFANLFNDPVGAIVHLFGDMAKSILGILEKIAGALDKVFGSDLAGSVRGWMDGLDKMVESVANKYGNGNYEKVLDELDLNSEKLGLQRMEYGTAWDKGYDFGANLMDGMSSEFNLAQDTSAMMGDIDWDNLNNTVGTDSTGGKAVKTTTKDKLISDDDIQLLLDVATRDYKLNYQKVEPNVTITFGDVRESADVDDILDRVADALEEIYDSDLEVAK